MDNKGKNTLIGALLAIIFVLAIGFSIFAQILTVGKKDEAANWDIHITSITPKLNGTATSTKSEVSSDKQSATFAATLLSPSDSVVYTVVVKNGGTINAKVADAGLTLTDNKENDPIHFTAEGIKAGDSLDAGEETQFTITAKYNDKFKAQPTEEQMKKSVTMTLNYIQK